MRFFRKKQEVPRPIETPIYLTKEGLERLRGKLGRLKSSLPELISETRRTADYGDRSENAEYKEAKSALRRTHRQIWATEAQLKRVKVISQEKNTSGVVELGSAVLVELSSGEKREYMILDSAETNPGEGRISYKSPLGAALLHRRKGETIRLQTANGTREYKIVEIN